MSEMVERVARALYDVEHRTVPGAAGRSIAFWQNETLDPAKRDYWFAAARAAIAAMRDTTMLRAGHSVLVPFFTEEAEAYGMADRVWQATIDEVLTDQS